MLDGEQGLEQKILQEGLRLCLLLRHPSASVPCWQRGQVLPFPWAARVSHNHYLSLSPQIGPERQALCSVIFSLKNCREKPNGYHYSSCCNSLLLFLKVKEEWTLGGEAVRRSRKKLFRAKGFLNFSSQLCRETGLRDQIK